MRAEKQFLSREYLARLNASPFFILVDYKGLSVAQFTELRKRLAKAGAEVHVVKNSVFRAAAKEAGVADLADGLAGQLAVVTGQKDVTAAAKTVKNFQAEFDKPKVRFGYLGNRRLELAEVQVLADLPSLDQLRAKLLGVFKAPPQKLVALFNTPASQLARVLQARLDKEKEPSPAAA
jgi:large subunit ribosomal protein L10